MTTIIYSGPRVSVLFRNGQYDLIATKGLFVLASYHRRKDALSHVRQIEGVNESTKKGSVLHDH